MSNEQAVARLSNHAPPLPGMIHAGRFICDVLNKAREVSNAAVGTPR